MTEEQLLEIEARADKPFETHPLAEDAMLLLAEVRALRRENRVLKANLPRSIHKRLLAVGALPSEES